MNTRLPRDPAAAKPAVHVGQRAPGSGEVGGALTARDGQRALVLGQARLLDAQRLDALLWVGDGNGNGRAQKNGMDGWICYTAGPCCPYGLMAKGRDQQINKHMSPTRLPSSHYYQA